MCISVGACVCGGGMCVCGDVRGCVRVVSFKCVRDGECACGRREEKEEEKERDTRQTNLETSHSFFFLSEISKAS